MNRCGNCMYYDGDDSDTFYCNQLDGYTKGEMFDCDKFVEIQAEAVNHPKHYNQGKFEVIDVIEDWNLGFNLGNTVKYIARADHKANAIEDLKKAFGTYNVRLKGEKNDGGHCDLRSSRRDTPLGS